MNPSIIKARAVHDAAPAIVSREAHEAVDQAQQIIGEANRRAAQMIEAAQFERASVLADAQQQGYASGLAEWNKIVAAAREARETYLEQNKDALVRLAVRIAEKLIGEELRTNPDTILNIIHEALRALRRERSLFLQVHPDDEAYVRSRIGSLESTRRRGEIEVSGSAAVRRGGCIVESDLGVIDARLETQLKTIEEALLRSQQR